MDTSVAPSTVLQDSSARLREDKPHDIIFYRFLRYVPEDFNVQSDLHNAFESCGALTESVRALHRLIAPLAEIHPPTLEHSYRVAWLSYKLAKLEGLDPYPALCAGLVHDCGKSRIEVSLLEKEGEWTKEDANKMKDHVMHGYEIVHDAGLFFEADILARHHQFQKNPYPEKLPEISCLRDELEIVRYARIVALADCFDSRHRINEYCGQRAAPTGEQIRNEMLSGNADTAPLVQSAFDSGTFPIIACPTITTYRRITI